MERRHPQKLVQQSLNKKGLTVFICIALVLALGLGAVVYLPKLLNKKTPDGQQDVYDINTQIPVITAGPGITASPTWYVDPKDPNLPVITEGPGITASPTSVPGVTAAPGPGETAAPPNTVGIEANGAVSCSNPYATEVGKQVLNNGGNAVDAAIAMAYALGVVEPYASGIGGGGGMLVYDPKTDEYAFYDYRDAACSNIQGSLATAKIGLPGFVLGMETVSKNHGSMNIGTLIQPSIEYAENGFQISASFARHLQSSKSKLSSKNNPQFFKNNKLLVEGDTIVQKDMANTLRLIQRYGSTVFYHGAIAQHIIANSRLTQEDFDNYKVMKRTPVTGTYKGYKVVSAPAPFSGTTLIQMLEIAEQIDLETYDGDIVRYAKLMASLSSVTLRDRRKNICDPEYHTVPSNLLSEQHIASLAKKVKSGNAEYIEPDPEHESTTHISVIDKNGMMVSMTNTLSDFFGYGVYVDGFFLNNTIKTSAGDPSARNYCVRGQRPRSFAMPTFLIGKDGTKVALGSSGGDRIPQVVMQIIVRYTKGEDLQSACDKPRLVFEGYCYYMENDSIDPSGSISKAGYYKLGFSSREYFGAFNAVGISKNGKAFGASDSRRYGSFDTAESPDSPRNS